MCEKSCRPVSACSGLVKIELKRVTFPGAVLHIPGCRGVALLLGKPVFITPIGFNRKVSSSSVLVLGSAPDIMGL